MRKSEMKFGARIFHEQLKDKGRSRRAAAKPNAGLGSLGTRRNDLLPTLAVSQVPTGSLIHPQRNIRRIDATHVRETAEAIGAFGFCVPILIDLDQRVVDGVIRLEAARLLGLDTVPCIAVGHLSAAEVRLLRAATNRLTEKGGWNLDALKVEFEELLLTDLPIGISGFTLDEIDQICLNNDDVAIEPGVLDPEPNAAVSRLGDCYILGRHRLHCGDATDPLALRSVFLPTESVRLILTDEPYNVPISGHVTKGRHREFAMASGEMDPQEYLAFNTAWMKNAAVYLCDGGVLASFCDWRAWPSVHEAATAIGLRPLNLVVWTKTNAGMGSLYRSQHELLPLFKKGNASYVNNVALGARGRWRSNVWSYAGATSLGSEARKGLQEHPTVKPSAMLEDALLDLTNRNDVVFDPFLGSGSTLIAAERAGRTCRGIEIDPLYVDVVIRRFQKITKTVATLVETGETFDALAQRRAKDLEGAA